MKIQVPYFNNAEVELDQEVGAGESALSAFLTLENKDRMSDSPHVFAYFKDFRSALDEGDWPVDTMGSLKSAEDIWKYVSPGPVFVEKGRDEDHNWYVVMEAECAWEKEHGLMLVWRNGAVLNKVGGYDGHWTNAGAYDDARLGQVVYSAVDKRYTTYLESRT